MVKNLKVGEIDFTRISRGTQFHFLWNISRLGEYSGEDFHFVDPEGKEFSFDDENIFKVTNVSDFWMWCLMVAFVVWDHAE